MKQNLEKKLKRGLSEKVGTGQGLGSSILGSDQVLGFRC
ncbi:hypothetical protein Pint_15587 [Pistacia integerrima]|uniref:Uncharacterized protein n=1 Tax=Pistacia integerrima TaxID=434235 RepID=A0ACC0ZFF8_9ROSI|nr:hypothetical protein Pint_15587 [Pistacia integerrima]